MAICFGRSLLKAMPKRVQLLAMANTDQFSQYEFLIQRHCQCYKPRHRQEIGDFP